MSNKLKGCFLRDKLKGCFLRADCDVSSKKHILKTFTEEAAANAFVDLLFTKEELDITNQIEEMFKDLSV